MKLNIVICTCLFKSVSQQIFIGTTQICVEKRKKNAFVVYDVFWSGRLQKFIILVNQKASVCCLFKKGLAE